jgi:hypothetical protein
MFNNRKIVIATKHKKEQVIAPLLLHELNLNAITCTELDTDLLGTFSGEIERNLSPIEAAKQKCYLAMDQTQCDMAIASEGSFGPHPTLFFVNADDEILVFIDRKNDIEIIVRQVSTDTNFNGTEIVKKNELKLFAEKALFPSHGLIMRDKKDSIHEIIKGIDNWEMLQNTFDYFKAKYGSMYIETDMRAQFNPKRMEVIKQATQKLITKIKSACPQCQIPGFSIIDVKRGLPCKICNMPTESPIAHIYKCNQCAFTLIKEITEKPFEDPMHCNFCNP